MFSLSSVDKPPVILSIRCPRSRGKKAHNGAVEAQALSLGLMALVALTLGAAPPGHHTDKGDGGWDKSKSRVMGASALAGLAWKRRKNFVEARKRPSLG